MEHIIKEYRKINTSFYKPQGTSYYLLSFVYLISIIGYSPIFYLLGAIKKERKITKTKMSRRNEAIDFAIKKIPEILPLDKQEIKDLCNQILDNNHNPDSIADAFFNILGQEDLPFQFVLEFNDILNNIKRDSTIEKLEEQKHKNQKDDNKLINIRKSNDNRVIENRETIEQAPLIQISQKNTIVQKPVVAKIFDKKQSTNRKRETQTSSKKNKLKSLEEIEDAVRYLSATHEEKDSGKYKCSCLGKLHPIFSIAPNCLSCGKIICVREGLHLNNCTFCGAELIPFNERMQLIEALKEEENSINNSSNTKPGKEQRTWENKKESPKTYKISTGMGKNLFDQQDKLFDFIERQKERERKREQVLRERDEQEKLKDTIKANADNKQDEIIDEDLRKAQERLENLLHFQDTSAERTKIIDNASDFNISNDVGLWGSAREKALLLKKQQRNLRKWEKLERERNGRKDKYVVSLDIKADGKVIMKETVKDNNEIYAQSDDDINDISDEEDIRDLQAIHDYKNQLSTEREIQDSTLQSKTWDYERDKEQFERPIYIGSDGEVSNIENKQKDKSTWKSRVQVNNSGDMSVEQNILAVL